jgi:hypothetical protein
MSIFLLSLSLSYASKFETAFLKVAGNKENDCQKIIFYKKERLFYFIK